MQGLMIFRWRTPRAGREAEALRFVDESDAYWRRLRDEGAIAGYEWVSNVTGADHDMFIVRGAPESLIAVTMSPEFGALTMRGAYLVEGWHWDMAVAGATVDEVYPGWRELIAAA